jgi:hypothetical protein
VSHPAPLNRIKTPPHDNRQGKTLPVSLNPTKICRRPSAVLRSTQRTQRTTFFVYQKKRLFFLAFFAFFAVKLLLPAQEP